MRSNICRYGGKQRIYLSYATDLEWVILELLIPVARPDGRSQEIDWREVVNGILYVFRS